MNRKYELVYVVSPDASDDQVADLHKQVEAIIQRLHGQLDKTENWGRRKVCKFCADKIDDINYKDVKLIGPFVPERGKILPRRISGTCAMHQRKLQTAIKRARQIALIPYVTD